MQHVSWHWHGEKLMDYDTSEICRLIDEKIHSERNRQILKKRLCDGIHFEPLAEMFDLSVRQVKNIVYKAEKELFLTNTARKG